VRAVRLLHRSVKQHTDGGQNGTIKTLASRHEGVAIAATAHKTLHP
jgi:hypothetical protein